MGGAVGVQPGRVRHWGPIEVIWTVATALALLVTLLLGLGWGVLVRSAAMDLVTSDEVGRPESWRLAELDGIRTELPGSPDYEDDVRVKSGIRLDIASVEGNGGAVALAQIDAPPPTDGAQARAYADAVSRAGPLRFRLPVTAAPPAAVETPLGLVYEEQVPGPTWTIWRVVVTDEGTFVLAAWEAGVEKWYPRSVDQLETAR